MEELIVQNHKRNAQHERYHVQVNDRLVVGTTLQLGVGRQGPHDVGNRVLGEQQEVKEEVLVEGAALAQRHVGKHVHHAKYREEERVVQPVVAAKVEVARRCRQVDPYCHH